jgi:hypothetical protein
MSNERADSREQRFKKKITINALLPIDWACHSRLSFRVASLQDALSTRRIFYRPGVPTGRGSIITEKKLKGIYLNYGSIFIIEIKRLCPDTTYPCHSRLSFRVASLQDALSTRRIFYRPGITTGRGSIITEKIFKRSINSVFQLYTPEIKRPCPVGT